MKLLKNKINSLKNLSQTGKIFSLFFLGLLSISIYLLNTNIYLQKNNRLLKTSLSIKPTPTPEPAFGRFSPRVILTPSENGIVVSTVDDWFKFLVPSRFSYEELKCDNDCLSVGQFTDVDTIISETHGPADSFSVAVFASNLSFTDYVEQKKEEFAKVYDSLYKPPEATTTERVSYELPVGERTGIVLGSGYVTSGYRFLYVHLPNRPLNKTYILQISHNNVEPLTPDYPDGVLASFNFVVKYPN
jgi:hypothetical protein